VEDVGGKMVFSGGESNIAVFAINQQTGEPTAIQHADIRAALQPNLCRCGTHMRVLRAVKRAARLMQTAGASSTGMGGGR